jgi:biopolymer transport protein TolR
MSVISDMVPAVENSEPTTADLTPLMDTICQIIFLLLAMLIGSSVVGSLPVNLPAVSSSTDVRKENQVIEISVNRDGNIHVGQELVSLADLGRVVQTLAAGVSSPKVFVRADTDLAYGRVAIVLSRLSNLLPGREVALIVQKTASEPAQGDSSRKEESGR